ncbi:MAG: hypothetical protein K0R22_1790 [Sporomusa sp.]|jgi:hypothetical protein|nr:hypothetical protein [Sporomusa sp.]
MLLVVVIAAYLFFPGMDKSFTIPEKGFTDSADLANRVTITPMPSLRIIHGIEVPFTGKIELRQAIAGRAARDISVVNFEATGENAEKSVIKIVWENGEIEKVSPGTKNKIFSADKRAVEIIVTGYSMHERRIFRDNSRKGTLTWEIRYEPVE